MLEYPLVKSVAIPDVCVHFHQGIRSSLDLVVDLYGIKLVVLENLQNIFINGGWVFLGTCSFYNKGWEIGLKGGIIRWVSNVFAGLGDMGSSTSKSINAYL